MDPESISHPFSRQAAYTTGEAVGEAVRRYGGQTTLFESQPICKPEPVKFDICSPGFHGSRL
jgi:hypothetical protein